MSNYVKFITIHPKWLELWPMDIQGLKLLINSTTMKFYEILTKAKSDISKILNFTRKPLFP